MNVARLNPQRRPPQRKPARRRGHGRRQSPFAVAGVMFAAIMLTVVAVKTFAPEVSPQAVASVASSSEISMTFAMCGRVRHTCVVDGDTIWLNGENLRMQGHDTPEPYTNICGGAAELALAKRASARLLELLNSGPFTVETFGLDNTRRRTLATIRIGGRDVGDILIQEGLARSWPDGEEWWCRL